LGFGQRQAAGLP